MPVCEADPWRLQYFEGVPGEPERGIDDDLPRLGVEHRQYFRVEHRPMFAIGCAARQLRRSAFTIELAGHGECLG